MALTEEDKDWIKRSLGENTGSNSPTVKPPSDIDKYNREVMEFNDEKYQKILEHLKEVQSTEDELLENLKKRHDLEKQQKSLQEDVSATQEHIKELTDELNQSDKEKTKELQEQIALEEKILIDKKAQLGLAGENLKTTADQAELEEKIKKAHEETLKATLDKLNADEARSKALEKQVEWYNRSNTAIDKTRNLYQSITSLLSNGYQMLMGFIKPWGEIDDAAMKYARTIGMSPEMKQNLEDQTNLFVARNSIAQKLNITSKELIDLQTSYSKELGRSVMMSNDQLESIGAMSKIMGEGQAIKMATGYERFGKSVTETDKAVTSMFNKAVQQGLSAEKITANVADNLNMASTYAFKEGVNGLMKMAEESVRINMNMKDVAAFAGKVNTIQGAVETAANLQVLGGSIGAFADPLSMLGESLTNLPELQKRMESMLSGSYHLNQETGEMQASPAALMRINEAAKSMGISPEDFAQSSMQLAKRNAIGNQFDSVFAGNDKLKELFTNQAYYDKEKGAWGVKDENGNFESAAQLKASVSEQKRLTNITQTQEKNVADIATNTRSINEVLQGFGNQKNEAQARLVKRLATGQSGQGGLKGIVNSLGSIPALMTAIAGIGMAAKFAGTVFGGVKGIGRGIGAFGNGGGKIVGSTLSTAGMSEKVSMLGKRKAAKYAAEKGFMGLGGAGAKGVGKSLLKGKNLMGPLGIAAIAGDLILPQVDEYFKKNYGEGNTGSVVATTAQGALNGAAMGAMFGPWGAGIGAVLGGGYSAVKGATEARQFRAEQSKESLATNTGVHLKGTYAQGIMKQIDEALLTGDSSKLSKRAIARITENGDQAAFQELFAKGKENNKGINSENATINVKNANININGHSVKSGKLTGGNFGSEEAIKFSPLQLVMSGGINLNLPNGSADAISAQLLKSPVFIDKLTKLIRSKLPSYATNSNSMQNYDTRAQLVTG